MPNAAIARIPALEEFDSDYGSEFPASVPAAANAAPATPADGLSARIVRLICSLRRERQAHFPGPLGTQACWDVLLQLYAAHIDQYRLTIGQVATRTGNAGTSVLRAIETLAEAGLLNRTDDRYDRRRVFVELSPKGVSAMTDYITSGSRAAFL